MTRASKLLVGLLGVCGLTAACLFTTTSAIETATLEAVRDAVDAEGLGHLHVEVVGRDVTLSGMVPDEDTRRRALHAAHADGVTFRVIDELRLDPRGRR